ncbi:zinc finger BED domain-containing protein 4-like isoform X2 [Notolabrus celidotus]|uniref:zinc finger BED domain-containing protein 4-like isoform X2 n=1 Tax=Notolabrus celidotus TaxID=1203425 RepID=UPI00149000B4|nr:zinc finger BED domain-containing protein 4-like isoform X2 [Notolabrus celidotus]
MLDNLLPSLSPRAQRITESLVHFICKDLQPCNVVNNAGFRWMVQTLEPRYKIPQRVHMVNAVPKMYEEVEEAVKMYLSSAQRVALTCDGWTSRATESYEAITSQHISTDARPSIRESSQRLQGPTDCFREGLDRTIRGSPKLRLMEKKKERGMQG